MVATSDYDATARTFIVRAGDGSGPELARSAAPDVAAAVSLGRSPGTVVMLQRSASGHVLSEVPLTGGQPTILQRDDNAGAPLLDRITRQTIGVWENGEARFYDELLNKRVRDARAAFGDDRSRLVSYSQDLDRMVFHTEGPRNSGRFFLLDVVGRTASSIGPKRADVPADQVGAVRLVKFKASDGLAMDGVLTLPPGREAKGLPVVVMPHGGPIVGRDRVTFYWWAQAFASRGICGLSAQFPGHAGLRGSVPEGRRRAVGAQDANRSLRWAGRLGE